jgi:serine/threonine protein phosphatase PrpC
MKIDYVFDEGSKREDAYFIGKHQYGVFDGFNGWTRFYDDSGQSGGQIAATIAKNVFSQGSGDLKPLAINANQKIKEHMLKNEIDIHNKGKLWGTSFAVVRIKSNTFEWIQIGDANIVLINGDKSFNVLVKDYDHDEEILTLWKQLASKGKDNIRELVNEPLLELRNKMNITHGCLNGEKQAIAFINAGVEKLDNVKHIILFTDGLLIPKEDPSGDDDWALFVELFLRGGLQKVKEYVRNIEKTDPKCWKYPRYKQHDDIAAISISF